MIIESKGEQYTILYKIYKSKENLQIYDFELQGISIISTYRSQNNQILTDGSIDDLFNMLSSKDGDESQAIIRHADAALYKAKESGRNQVVLAGETAKKKKQKSKSKGKTATRGR